MKKSDIKKAAIVLGRRSPTSKYLPLVIEVALLAPQFASKPSEGLDPTFYHTGSYNGDMEQYKRLEVIISKVLRSLPI